MQSDIVDMLYKYYKKYDSNVMENAFKAAFYKYAKNNEDSLTDHLKEYISSNLGNLPNYFMSAESEESQHKKISSVVSTLEDLAYITDEYLDDLREKMPVYDYEKDEELDPYNEYEFIESVGPIKLLSTYTGVIKEAYENHKAQIPTVSDEMFTKAIELIEYVQSHRSLRAIFRDNNYNDFTISQVIEALYDYHSDKPELFDFEEYEVDDDYHFLNYFNDLKDNCHDIKEIKFKNYRQKLTYKNGISTDIDKLIFARNLIEYYKSGMMPRDGFLDCSIDEYLEYKTHEDFRKLYSKSFDNKNFMQMQRGFIIDADACVLPPDKVERIKRVQKDKSLAIGTLLSKTFECDGVKRAKFYYLMHIYIDDVTNDKSNYEIQLNILPEGKLKHRLQLVRFDNWKDQQSHKNLRNKLRTTTHIHLYNPLDILRGKTHGDYDIAFNLSDNSTDFPVSLQVFLDMILEDEETSILLHNKLLKIKDEASKKALEPTTTM